MTVTLRFLIISSQLSQNKSVTALHTQDFVIFSLCFLQVRAHFSAIAPSPCPALSGLCAVGEDCLVHPTSLPFKGTKPTSGWCVRQWQKTVPSNYNATISLGYEPYIYTFKPIHRIKTVAPFFIFNCCFFLFCDVIRRKSFLFHVSCLPFCLNLTVDIAVFLLLFTHLCLSSFPSRI